MGFHLRRHEQMEHFEILARLQPPSLYASKLQQAAHGPRAVLVLFAILGSFSHGSVVLAGSIIDIRYSLQRRPSPGGAGGQYKYVYSFFSLRPWSYLYHNCMS